MNRRYSIHRGRSRLLARLACVTGLSLGLATMPLLAGCSAARNQPNEAQDQKTDEKAEEKHKPGTPVVVEDSTDPHEKEDQPKEKEGPIQPERSAALKAQLEPIVAESGMTTTVSIVDLTTGMVCDINGEEQLPSASMIKLLVASAFLRGVDRGTYALDDSYTLQYEDIVGGTGSLGGRGAGAAVTYRELIELMISQSDNTATNALLSTMGFDAVNAEAKKLKLKATSLNRRMMDEQARTEGRENYTCANDLALLLRMVYEERVPSEEGSSLLRGALEGQQDEGGIRSGLPGEVIFAHKTGALDVVYHDGGIVEGDHPFVLVVLCGGEGFWEQGARNTMARIAEVTYAEMANATTAAETPAEESPAEESPAEETPAEETPAEEPLAEETAESGE